MYFRFFPFIRIIGISIVLILSNSCEVTQSEFVSEHFTIEKLSDGVWAAIHTPGGEAICNAGIIDLGDKALVFDCFLTPRAAQDLKTAAETLTGKTVSYLINSHYHNDHIRGNQVFAPQTTIISTKRIKRLIQENEPLEIQSEKEYGPSWLAEMKEEFKTVTDSTRKQELIMWIAYVKGMLDSHSSLKTILPDSLFSESLEIKGSERTIKLIEYQDGHTENDIVLLLEKEKILFAGDLLFVDCHPYLANGNPFNLINILNELKQIESKVIVPGHGPVGNKQDLEKLIDYIGQVNLVSQQYIAQGKSKEEISDSDIPEGYSDWLFPNFFKYNLGYMLEEATKNPNEYTN